MKREKFQLRDCLLGLQGIEKKITFSPNTTLLRKNHLIWID